MVDRTDITSANLCRLLGIMREALSGLVKRGIVRRGERKGGYDLQASVSGYQGANKCDGWRS